MTDYRISRGRAGRRGNSLMELLTAVAISSVLVLGVASAVSVSMQTLSITQTSTSTSIQGSQILDQIVTEMQSAVFVTERTGTTMAFTIPDQNSDGYPERVRYAWTGTSGGALTRQFNGGTPQVLASSVDLFTLTPSYKSVQESYPALGVEDATESLLIDDNGTGSLGNNNEQTNNWLGQYFTYTLPANSYAWRPTTVKFMAKKNSSPAVTLVQMRPPTASLTPSSTVLEQYSLADTALTGSYVLQSFTFTTLAPQASGSGICLVLQWQSGTTALVAENCNLTSGMLKTTNSGTSWTTDNGHCLCSQLYGKLTTSSGTKSLNSNYLTTQAIQLRMTSTSPTLQQTAALLNHPEMLSNEWELKFDQTPTTVDMNGDAAMDWVVHGGSAFLGGNLDTVAGVWTTHNQQLDTNPGCDFAKTTIVDVKMQSTALGGSGTQFTMNALRNGSNCVPLIANLMLQSDGTQTMTVSAKTNDSTTNTLISITGLPAAMTFLHMIIDPSINAVNVSINNVQRGTFGVTPYASSDASRYASITAVGGTGLFSYCRIRVLDQ